MNENSFENIDDLKITITDHCYKRYVDRVRNGATLPQNKIEEEIKKLFLSSDKIYSGKIGKKNNPVEVYCNKNGWVILKDINEPKLITLYKIDLELDDDDFNQMYITKALSRIYEFKKDLDDAKETSKNLDSEQNEELTILSNQITEYKNIIKQLEARKSCIISITQTNNSLVKAKEQDLRRVLEDYMIKDKLKVIEE